MVGWFCEPGEKKVERKKEERKMTEKETTKSVVLLFVVCCCNVQKGFLGGFFNYFYDGS